MVLLNSLQDCGDSVRVEGNLNCPIGGGIILYRRLFGLHWGGVEDKREADGLVEGLAFRLLNRRTAHDAGGNAVKVVLALGEWVGDRSQSLGDIAGDQALFSVGAQVLAAEHSLCKALPYRRD